MTLHYNAYYNTNEEHPTYKFKFSLQWKKLIMLLYQVNITDQMDISVSKRKFTPKMLDLLSFQASNYTVGSIRVLFSLYDVNDWNVAIWTAKSVDVS